MSTTENRSGSELVEIGLLNIHLLVIWCDDQLRVTLMDDKRKYPSALAEMSLPTGTWLKRTKS